MSSRTASYSNANAVEESLASQCRRHMEDPKLPPEITKLMHDTAKALEWQGLVLTGLSTRDKDVVGALSETIQRQRETIDRLEGRIHDIEREVRLRQAAETQNKNQFQDHRKLQNVPSSYDSVSADQRRMMEEIQRLQNVNSQKIFNNTSLEDMLKDRGL
jgi:hypothetical protein